MCIQLITVRWLLLCGVMLLVGDAGGQQQRAAAQRVDPAGNLAGLMRDVCRNQVAMLDRHDGRLRYQVQRIDRKGTTLRDQIESRDGGVARLLQHDGHTLTAEENDGERKRLEALLGSNKLQQRERDEAKNRSMGAELLQVMPDAMRFSLAPQQNPVPDVANQQVVVDFAPNPQFHPANMAQQILPALQGRVWVDLSDHQLLRMELHNSADVNLAWGLLAKVYAGGNVTYEQRRFQDVYTFTHIALHLRVRELMLKTVAMDTDTVASSFQRLGNPPSGDDAVRMLLADPVATR